MLKMTLTPNRGNDHWYGTNTVSYERRGNRVVPVRRIREWRGDRFVVVTIRELSMQPRRWRPWREWCNELPPFKGQEDYERECLRRARTAACVPCCGTGVCPVWPDSEAETEGDYLGPCPHCSELPSDFVECADGAGTPTGSDDERNDSSARRESGL